MAADEHVAWRDGLRDLLERGEELLNREVDYSDQWGLSSFTAENGHWYRDTSEFVEQWHGSAEVESLWYSLPVPNIHTSLYEQMTRSKLRIAGVLPRLVALAKRPPKVRPAQPSTVPAATATVDLTKVFIVHGHDAYALERVRGFVSDLDLTPAVLRDMPSGGRTVMEKIAFYAPQMAFALVILSSDDIGYRKDKPEEAQPRARQNVILEWGYLTALLGRARVSALRFGAVEMPSDTAGVVYINVADATGWQLEAAQEMRDAGLDAPADRIRAH